MKLKIIGIICCILVTILGLTSCKTEKDTVSQLNFSTEDQERLANYVEKYAAAFDVPYHSTDEIDENIIGWFSFWQIWEENDSVTDEEGYFPIAKETLRSFVFARFGIEEFEYPDILPIYDADKGGYQFYPVGEGSLNEIIIEDTTYNDDNTVIYTIMITTYPMDYPFLQPTSKRLTYTFSVEAVEGRYYLQAISAQQLYN